ncbi:MAG: AmmeMemoRadiSam system protein B [Spirochaetales bacterium]|nr:AmmeMemoRadiSam system protein B [Spirochaetales bacterium]
MAKKSQAEGKIRGSIVNGIFYPSEEDKLRSLLEKLLNESPEKPGNAFAIVSPHAGYSYAGGIIASAFKSALKRTIKYIVIIAPIHNNPSNGIFLPESKFFLTPIGSIPVNQEMVEEMHSCSTEILCKDLPHLEEHCIEVQLPFIRHLFPQASIIPVLLGNSAMRNIKMLSNALQLTFSPHYMHTLFVITANMSGYIREEDADRETELLISLIIEKNWKGIVAQKENKTLSSCGAGCIASILSFNNVNYRLRVIEQNSSLSIEQNRKKKVNYASIAIYNEENDGV